MTKYYGRNLRHTYISNEYINVSLRCQALNRNRVVLTIGMEVPLMIEKLLISHRLSYSRFSWVASLSSTLSSSELSTEEVTEVAHVTDLVRALGDTGLGGVSAPGDPMSLSILMPNPATHRKVVINIQRNSY